MLSLVVWRYADASFATKTEKKNSVMHWQDGEKPSETFPFSEGSELLLLFAVPLVRSYGDYDSDELDPGC